MTTWGSPEAVHQVEVEREIDLDREAKDKPERVCYLCGGAVSPNAQTAVCDDHGDMGLPGLGDGDE